MIKKIACVIVLFVTINSIAQKNNISPYSFFGIGEINEAKSVSELNMGGIGGAQNSLYKIHFTNPASYASLRLTTYTVAGNNKYLTVNDGVEEQSGSQFNLSYLALGFPVGEKAGVVFGIQPNSNVGYSILDNVNDTETNLFFGEGGTNKVFLGFGHKLPHNTSIGVEGAFTFGNIEKRILNRREDIILASLYETNSDITGFSLKLGVQNTAKINDKLELKSGITVNLENNLKTNGTERFLSLLNVSDPSLVIVQDVLEERDFNSEVNSPLKTNLSVGIAHKKWYAGLEYSFQDPVVFKNNQLQSANIEFIKTSKIALGGFYTPKAESLTNYWQRITYRAGFYSRELGYKINNTEIKDFGMSFGLTLPSKRKLSDINLGFDIGQKGEEGNGLVKENYFNFRLSLSFTDKWFRKRKLN